MKITFMGAGSTIFARNVIGDCMCCESLKNSEFALYDIDGDRLKESQALLEAINETKGNPAKITTFLGIENRKNALHGASFVVNAIQVGGYDPCTIIDFEIPKKYGFRQTIGDTHGVGGIMRALRTIPVLEDFARDMEEVCPNAWFLNYTNPMGMLTGYMLQHTGIKAVGLCHSVQVCAQTLLGDLDMSDKFQGCKQLIAGINHMGWLIEIKDKDGNDLYPEIRKRASEKLKSGEKLRDLVRYEYIHRLGYYCTESSEHNAEYSNWFIKSKYPELIEKYNIPLDEYPRRCENQIKGWAEAYNDIMNGRKIEHTRSREYASYIMNAITTNTPYEIGGNVLNTGRIIANLPEKTCVEVPCLVNGHGITPSYVGELPTQLAALNSIQANVQLLTIEAAKTKKKEKILQAFMFDPMVSSELSIDDMSKMIDDFIDAHGNWLPKYA